MRTLNLGLAVRGCLESIEPNVDDDWSCEWGKLSKEDEPASTMVVSLDLLRDAIFKFVFVITSLSVKQSRISSAPVRQNGFVITFKR